MSWFRVDDGWADHSKVRRAEKDGRALWPIAGVKCAQNGTDGLVDPLMLRESYAPLAGVQWRKAAQLLVSSGLWHDTLSVHDCDRCCSRIAALGRRDGITADGDLDAGWYYFHDWSDYQQAAKVREDPIAKLADKRGRQLRRSTPGQDLRERVRRRDRDLCRYCGVRCVFDTQDRKSATVGTFDHIDPFDFTSGFGGNSMKNVVVACNLCNGRKGQRTPEQWVADEPEEGWLLQPPPGVPRRSRPDQVEINDGSEQDHDLVEVGSGADRDRSSRDARPRTGSDPDRVGSLIGAGSGPGPGGGS